MESINIKNFTENKSNEKIFENENNLNLNEIAINSKVPDTKELKKDNKKYVNSFDKFYYSMWISNKD
jgi:hypothetical protein